MARKFYEEEASMVDSVRVKSKRVGAEKFKK